jgi:uncharacterized membrane protein
MKPVRAEQKGKYVYYSKKLGGIGSILMILGSFIPYIAVFGIFMILVALYGFSKIFNDKRIFQASIISGIFIVLGFVFVIGYGKYNITFLKVPIGFVNTLFFLGIIGMAYSFELMYRYTKVIFYKVFYILIVFGYLFIILANYFLSKNMYLLIALLIWVIMFVILSIAFFKTTDEKMEVQDGSNGTREKFK